MTETELEPCFLPPSKLCYSICSVNAPVRSCQLIPVGKENCLILWHTCWSLIVGKGPQTLWSLSTIQHLFCYIPVLHQLCNITILGFLSQPSSLPPCSLSSASPAYSFLGWLFLLGIPKAATGSKVVNETFAEENHLSQPQSSTESLEAGSLKQQIWNSVKTKLILLRLIIHPGWVGFPGWLKHSCQISCFSSKVWDLWDCLKMRLSFFLMWGKLTLVEKSKSILAEIFIYSLRQFLIQAHMHHMYPALGRHLPWKMWALVAEDWQWHQQWKMWSNSRNYQAAFNRWVFPMPP